MADGFANSWVEGEPAHLLASAASPVDTRKPSSSPDEAPRSRRSGAKRAVSVRGRSPRSHRRGRSFQLPDLECCQATHPPGSCACTETRARSRRRGEPIAPPSLSWASPPAHGAHCTLSETKRERERGKVELRLFLEGVRERIEVEDDVP
eukprot:scaffold71_cov247-Pinguiococcus_pyrenoidosus.AAC.43